jgi:DNA-binding winged helix-turn-helix (wHTH) protein
MAPFFDFGAQRAKSLRVAALMIGLWELMFAVRKRRTMMGGDQCFSLGPNLIADPLRFRITRDGREVPVEPRVMELLVYLSSRAGRVVSKRELMEEVWRTNVVDDAIHRAISLLRSALGDSPHDSRFIETVPRRGYRMLIAPKLLLPRRRSPIGAWLTAGAALTAAALAWELAPHGIPAKAPLIAPTSAPTLQSSTATAVEFKPPARAPLVGAPSRSGHAIGRRQARLSFRQVDTGRRNNDDALAPLAPTPPATATLAPSATANSTPAPDQSPTPVAR